MSRVYPSQPVPGVGAVVWRGDGRLLLVRRGRPPRRGEWSLPGGVQHVGETVRQAVCREVAEECGIAIEIVDVAAVIDLLDHDEAGRVRYHYVVTDVAARWLSGEARAGDDADAVAWVAPSELAAYGVAEATARVVALAAARMSKAGEAALLDRMMGTPAATRDGSR